MPPHLIHSLRIQKEKLSTFNTKNAKVYKGTENNNTVTIARLQRRLKDMRNQSDKWGLWAIRGKITFVEYLLINKF